VVLFELVARAASIEGLAPYAQADAALALVAERRRGRRLVGVAA
jgi:hypothetical protein